MLILRQHLHHPPCIVFSSGFSHTWKKHFNKNNPNNIDFPEFGSPLHAFHTPYHMLSTQHIRHNVGG